MSALSVSEKKTYPARFSVEQICQALSHTEPRTHLSGQSTSERTENTPTGTVNVNQNQSHPPGLSASDRTNNTPVSVKHNQQHPLGQSASDNQTELTTHPLGPPVSVTQKPHLSCICVSLQTVECNSQGFVCGRVWSDSAAALDAVLTMRQFVGGIVCAQLLVDSA